MLIAALEEHEDSGTTQKEDVKITPAKMLSSTHCMRTICIFIVNATIVKVENENISGYYSKSYNLPIDTKYLMGKTLAGTPTLSTCSLQMQRFLLPFRP